MNVSIAVRSPRLALLAQTLGGAGRARLSAAMGLAVKELTREHLAQLAASKHTTAEKLGAAPTGHFEQAARAVEDAPLTSDELSASFTIRHPGIGRAFHGITITPKNGATYIPLAMNAIAYGRRPREFDQVQFVHRGEAVRTDIAAYLLVRSVTQKQDRSLLPSDAAWQAAAAQGARDFIAAIPA